MALKLYTSKTWLERKYIKEGLNVDEIAKICGCSKSTIDNYLVKFGLQRKRRKL